MDRSLLVRILGFPATIIHGDTLVLDRWRWVKDRLPRTRNNETLLDVGCGSGAFSIGAALRGYSPLGLSWDTVDLEKASQRAEMCNASGARFECWDVRLLHDRKDLVGAFDVVLCLENIEHLIDDAKLMQDMAACLRPGGRLLLTTPFMHYKPITPGDMGPFSKIEDGWHVRRGYSPPMLKELCSIAGLVPERITYCSGYLSQKVTFLFRMLGSIHPLLAWALTLPLRVLPPILDWLVTPALRWPWFSICLEAYKPRYGIGDRLGEVSGNRPVGLSRSAAMPFGMAAQREIGILQDRITRAGCS